MLYVTQGTIKVTLDITTGTPRCELRVCPKNEYRVTHNNAIYTVSVNEVDPAQSHFCTANTLFDADTALFPHLFLVELALRQKRGQATRRRSPAISVRVPDLPTHSPSLRLSTRTRTSGTIWPSSRAFGTAASRPLPKAEPRDLCSE